MKYFYLFVFCTCFAFAQETSSLTEENCDTPQDQSLIGNELDLGQRFCDSNDHVQKPIVQPKPKEPVEDAGLKKLEEFLNSFDCDTKAC